MKIRLTAKKGEWILVDPEVNGVYMVNYDEHNWRLIIRQLETDRSVFPPHLRLRLLQDAWHLTKKELLSPGLCLRLLSYIKYEDDAAVWKLAYEMFRYFNSHTDGTPFGYRLHAMMRGLIDERIKTSGEGGLSTYERNLAALGRHAIFYKPTPWLEEVSKFLKEFGG